MSAVDILNHLRQQGAAIGGLSADSRELRAGDAFVAYPGARTDGRHHIADALARGAAAVLWERDGFSWNDAWSRPVRAPRAWKWLAWAIRGSTSESGVPLRVKWV